MAQVECLEIYYTLDTLIQDLGLSAVTHCTMGQEA